MGNSAACQSAGSAAAKADGAHGKAEAPSPGHDLLLLHRTVLHTPDLFPVRAIERIAPQKLLCKSRPVEKAPVAVASLSAGHACSLPDLGAQAAGKRISGLFQHGGRRLPRNGDIRRLADEPADRARSVAGLPRRPVPDQIKFTVLAHEELREDGSREAGIVELDREIGTIIAGPLAPGGPDLGFADMDPVAGRVAAGVLVRDDANRLGLNGEGHDLAPQFA